MRLIADSFALLTLVLADVTVTRRTLPVLLEWNEI